MRLWMPCQTLRTQYVKDRKKSVKRLLCGSLKSNFMSMGDCQRKKASPCFGGMWQSMQQSPVFKGNMLISMPFFFCMCYTENCKTCSFSITLWIWHSDSGLTTNSIFLTWLVERPGSRLEISITNTSSEKPIFWNVLESHPFCFISNCRSDQNKVSFFLFSSNSQTYKQTGSLCALHLQDIVPFGAQA